MKESIFHKNEIYEEYVLDKLSELKKEEFEEHLLSCSYCQEQLEVYETIILGIKSQERKHLPVTTNSTNQRKIRIWISIAASIVLVSSLAIFFRYSPASEKSEITSDLLVPKDSLKVNVNSVENTIEPEIVNPKSITEKSEILLAEAYLPQAVFEKAIKNYTRAGSLLVISPQLSKEYKSTDSLIFNWREYPSDLLLVIFNNTGVPIFEEEVKPPFLLKQKLENGLYYWQVENSNESLFTSKFLVIN